MGGRVDTNPRKLLGELELNTYYVDIFELLMYMDIRDFAHTQCITLTSLRYDRRTLLDSLTSRRLHKQALARQRTSTSEYCKVQESSLVQHLGTHGTITRCDTT